MSNVNNLPPNEKSGMYKGEYHENGGIQVVVDNVKKVEIEGDEYHLCRESMSNEKVYHFNQKTNKEILDEIFRDNGCVFEQGKAKSGDFIVCKLVVLDDSKIDISGTVKDIVNQLQSENKCNVTDDSKNDNEKKSGGVLSDEEDGLVRLNVLRRMQRKSPTKEMAIQIRNLKSMIKSGKYKSGGGVKNDSVDYIPDLMAIHGLYYENLFFADKLGGISMPSIAIININHPILQFGDIILVSGLDVIEPNGSFGARIFNRDIYSATYPTIYSYVDKKAFDILNSELLKKSNEFSSVVYDGTRSSFSNFMNDLKNGVHYVDVINSVIKNNFIIYLFTKEKGINVDIPLLNYVPRYWSYGSKDDMFNEKLSNHTQNYPNLYNAILKDVYDFSSNELAIELSDAFKSNYREFKIENEEDLEFKKVKEEIFNEYFDDNGILKHGLDYSIFKDLVHSIRNTQRINYDIWNSVLRRIADENNDELREFIKGMIKRVLHGSYFLSNKTKKMDATIDNIYHYMGLNPIKSSEKTLAYGLGKAASMSAKEYNSISAVVRDKEHYTISVDDFENYKEKQSELWKKLLDNVRKYYKHNEVFSFDALDNLSKAVGDISKLENPSDEKISQILSKNGYGNTPIFAYQHIREFADCIRESPSQYFEVKIPSIVKVSDFVAAAIPHGMYDVVELLNKNGINNIEFYEKSNEESLSHALKLLSDKSEEEIIFKSGGSVKSKKLIKKDDVVTDKIEKYIKGMGGLKFYVEPTNNESLIGLHLPVEMAVYVPSTKDANVPISKDELQKRVDEVMEYLGKLFGGYSSSDIVGGYVSESGELIQEDITKVISFSTQDAYDKNKEKLAKKMTEWAKEWSQEAIGFELEGDLYYIKS